MQVLLFPRRKAGELRNPFPRRRAPLKVDGHAIQSLFDRRQGEAAKQLGISITAMKQLCRKLGIVRWPYRRQKKEESARAAARKTCSSVCGPAMDNSNMDAFEPAQTPHSEVSSASTHAGSAQGVDSQSPAGQDGFSATSSPLPSPPGNCGAYVRLSADRLSCYMADLDMAQAQKISPLAVARPPTAGPTFPQPVLPRSNAHWIPSPCDHQWPSVAHHEARARARAADDVKQAAVQVAAYVKEYGDPSYCLCSDAAGPQQLPGHLVFREDVAYSEEDDDLAWLMSFEKSNPYTA
jgi:hypothetical protein